MLNVTGSPTEPLQLRVYLRSPQAMRAVPFDLQNIDLP
jgi:hypothetical protein